MHTFGMDRMRAFCIFVAMKQRLITIVLLALSLSAGAQNVHFSKNSRIISSEDSPAAATLQRYLGEATGYAFPIVKGSPKKADILLREVSDLPEDAFRVLVEKGTVVLEGKGKSLSYAACDFLEQEVGMNYWGGGEYDLPRVNTVTVRPRTEIPAFRYRQ